ncbi:MAG: hypothetical protein U9Q05_03915 [Thermodesulfobacteriota bacterium]|nr:hypothetical protein [Thermodesulfobacteriota bacterium]
MRYNNRVENFREFYRSNKDRLFGYLLRMTGDYHLSADLMQDSFTRYFERYKDKDASVSLKMARAGIKTSDAITMTRSMIQTRFEEKSIIKAQNIVIEAHRKGLPIEPVMSKAFEGTVVPSLLTFSESISTRCSLFRIRTRGQLGVSQRGP